MSYKKLEIWQLAREVTLETHEMTLKLPKFEMFEESSQIRRSSKGTKSAIVEGYGRRKYKNDFIKFLIYAMASNDETRDHLENLFETKSLINEAVYNSILTKVNLLGIKIYLFIKSVEQVHKSPT
jgi:four helix bundle protein